MSIDKIFLTLAAPLLIAGCVCHTQDKFIKEGEIRLTVEEYDQKHLKLTVVNRSPTEIIINGLFSIGYVQSPIGYEIKNKNGIIEIKIDETSMPVLVDPKNYLVTLYPGGIYGAVVNKHDFISLYKISDGQCYDIRATYQAADRAHKILPSKFNSICF